MKQITEITADSKQTLNISLENNETFFLTLEYSDNQEIWLISIEYNTFTANNINLVSGANILRKYRNLLPFGITIVTNDTDNPFLLDDFATGRAEFYVLNEEEVAGVETDFYS